MKTKTTKYVTTLFLLTVFALLSGCSDRSPKFGIWNTKPEAQEYVLLTDKEAQTIGEMSPAPFPADNKQHWVMVKAVGEKPKVIKPTLKAYSVAALESGYTFLQYTRATDNDNKTEGIEWGWKVLLENRSKRDIYAYGGYSLFDKDGFTLASAGTDWDNEETGILIKAGERVTLQGKAIWRMSRGTKPYPPSRVARGDYKLFLRHDIFETLFDNLPSKK